MSSSTGQDDEEIRFAEETEPGQGGEEAWLILVVDDEPDVHSMTALILSDLRYHSRPLKLLSAYSAAEAQQYLEHYPQIAVALVDVVMEDDHAGLDLVRCIRRELRNSEIRLVLRTGQPGQAPQRQVVLDYDINDYRSKAELTADDLVISIIAALRSYEHIVSIETKVAERTRELLESREHLRAILESSPVGVGAMACDGRLTFANRRFAELFGKDQESLIGTAMPELLVKGDEREATAGRISRGEAMRDTELRLRRADGSAFWALLSGDPQGFAEQRGYLGWIHDISRLKQTETDLNAAKTQAEQATKAKSAFLATMSHEIRTPMNGVLGMLELLERTHLEAQQAETVSTIRESATALLRIIDDILDFSKIEAEKLVLEEVPVSIAAIVEGVAETLAPSAWRKELELLTYVDPAIPPALIGDPLRLRQILFNLGGNAIKFTEHGRVVLRVDLDRGTAIAGRVCIRMSVVDSGIGIPPEIQAILFQPYAQAEQSTARRFGGTGLGLSICRKLAEMMAGTVEVESAVGQGSTFTFLASLAAADTRFGDAAACGPLDPALLAGLTIAIATADAEARDFQASYLEAAGARVVASADGHALLNGAHSALAAGRPFDVAVLDARLYQTSLVAVREALILGSGGLAIPMVLIAQRSGDGKIRRTRASDAALTVIKPVRRAALIRAVATAAGRLAAETGRGRDADHPSRRATDAMPPRRVAQPSLTPPPTGGPLVLVAEDNAINRRVIAMQLASMGVSIEMVNDGKQALEALSAKDYALLLTDVHMPEMDGFELTRRVREREAGRGGRRMPIVAITANAFEGEADRFRTAGMDDYLCKPVQLTKLQATIERWLAAAGAPLPAPTPPAAAKSAAVTPAAVKPVAVKEAAAIDAAAMAALCGDDPALIREMFGDFVAVSRHICEELATAIRQRLPTAVRHCAHNLKGSSRTAGARPLGDAARALEVAAETADWAEVTRL
ncbi:MAG: response regulator, partial [Rhodospirillaceae bacterium]